MKKYVLPFLLLIAIPVSGLTLWEWYGGNLPSISERAKEYALYFSDEYKGTAEQNIRLLSTKTGNEETPIILRGAPSGIPALVATSSTAIVDTTATAIFATTTNCVSRLITTQGDAIKLTFSDYNNPTPSNTLGHVQLASTTIAYDAGTYGCGRVKAYSYGTQTLTVSETR